MMEPAAVPPPPQVVLRSYDTQERMQWVKAARIESTVTGPQRAAWEMLLLPLAHSTVVITSEGADNVQLSQLERDQCAFVVNMHGGAFLNGQHVSQREVFLLGPGAESCGRVAAGLQWAGVTFPVETLERCFELLEVPCPDSTTGGRTIFAPPAATVERLQHLLTTAWRSGRERSLLSTRAALTVFEEALLSSLVSIVAAPIDPYRRQVSQGRLFGRAMAYLRANPEAVGISELCEALGVGARTLFYAFNEFTGMSPARYMRLRRLHLVRQALLTDPTLTVTHAAVSYGFFELGRFAAQYRAAFGETPGETRRLSAGPRPAVRAVFA